MIRINEIKLSKDDIKELIIYDPISGKAYWNKRDAKWFKESLHSREWTSKVWNVRYAGKEIKAKSEAGYIRIHVFNKNYMLHRLIWLYMTGEQPNEIDHINGNKADNRWENLRNVTRTENNKNHCQRNDNKSGVTGVVMHKRIKKWHASIKFNGKYIHLGYFDDLEKAKKARKAAETEYGYAKRHGENKNVNDLPL